MLPLENDAFALRLTEAGTLLLRWKEKNREFETLPSAYPVTRATAETGSLELDLDCGGFALHASFTLPESGGVQLRLDGDGPMPEEIAWPPAWKMEPGDVGIYPFGTGYAVPAAELEFPLPGRMAFYAGNQASMSLFGFLRDGLCVLTGVECGSDAELDNAPFDGLRSRSRICGSSTFFRFDASMRLAPINSTHFPAPDSPVIEIFDFDFSIPAVCENSYTPDFTKISPPPQSFNARASVAYGLLSEPSPEASEPFFEHVVQIYEICTKVIREEFAHGAFARSHKTAQRDNHCHISRC